MNPPDLDGFDRALTKFKNSLTNEQSAQFSISTLRDVQDVIRSIQEEHGAKGRLRNMRRISAFVEAVDQFGKVVDVFLNANQLVCFIWGPIKFLLLTTQNWVDGLDALLGAYADIGESIPGLIQYRGVFERYPTLSHVLEDYYSDILEFHKNALAVFCRPRWQQYFRSTWKTFNSKFRPILNSLNNKRRLIEGEKNSAMMYEVQKAREDIAQIRKTQMETAENEDDERFQNKLSRLRGKLKIPDYQMDHEMAIENRTLAQSGNWIFDHSVFRNWCDKNTSGCRYLYINGIPGAGKTTLAATVIEHALDHRTTSTTMGLDIVLYFYCKHDQPDKQSFNSILRGLLDQFIIQDKAFFDVVNRETSSMDTVKLRSTAKLASLLHEGVKGARTVAVIIDGLDECARNESSQVIEWLLSLENEVSHDEVALRIAVSGQRDTTLYSTLNSRPTIRLEKSDHSEDIWNYCRLAAAKIGLKFDLSKEMQDSIAVQVARQADGMFLYAKVVLENLNGQTKLYQLKRELEPGIFPRGIEKAYDRVMFRIFEECSDAERDDAESILGWVISAQRVLRWREIQSRFCIDPTNGNVEYEDRRLRVTCKELCGSLVDIHHEVKGSDGPNDSIQIVHSTARDKKPSMDLALQNNSWAIFCLKYLVTGPFTHWSDADKIRQYALRGSYGLQDYAASSWFHHSKEYMATKLLDGPQSDSLKTSLSVFLVQYSTSNAFRRKIEGPNQALEDIMAHLPTDTRERHDLIELEARTKRIRNVLESLRHLRRSKEPLTKAFESLQGLETTFQCPKPWCAYFSSGFVTSKERQKHVDQHELPYQCPYEDCFASDIGFSTEEKVIRHVECFHTSEVDEIHFPQIATKRMPDIFKAAAKGDVSAIEYRIQRGENLDRRDPRGLTPLQLSASRGHINACKALLDGGANPNKVSDGLAGAETALHIALSHDQIEIVHLLLLHPEILPDEPDMSRRSPLSVAAGFGHLGVVQQLLLLSSVDPCLEDDDEQPPLYYACQNGHTAVVDVLLPRSAEYLKRTGRKNRHRLLARAAQSGSRSIVNSLLESGRFDHGIPYAFRAALSAKHDDLAEFLLGLQSPHRDVDQLNRCMIAVCKNGSAPLVERLAAHPGLNVNTSYHGLTPLIGAIIYSCFDVVEVLLNYTGVDLDYTGSDEKTQTPFAHALLHWRDPQQVSTDRVDGLLKRLIPSGEAFSGRRSFWNGPDAPSAEASPEVPLELVLGNFLRCLAGEDQDLFAKAIPRTGVAYDLLEMAVETASLEIIAKILVRWEDLDSQFAQHPEDVYELLLKVIDKYQSACKDQSITDEVVRTMPYHVTKAHLQAGQGLFLPIAAMLRYDASEILHWYPNPISLSHERVMSRQDSLLNSHVLELASSQSSRRLLTSILGKSLAQELLNRAVRNGHYNGYMYHFSDAECRAASTLFAQDSPPINSPAPDYGKAVVRSRGDFIQTISHGDQGPWMTRLMYECLEGNSEQVEHLLQQPGIDVNVKDADGRPALTYAASKGDIHVMDMLLSVDGIDADLADNEGWTPLFWAVSGGNTAAVSLLLGSQLCDRTKRDQRGMDALELARKIHNDLTLRGIESLRTSWAEYRRMVALLSKVV